MSSDLLGPGSNATNVVTTRPAETRVFGAIDTFFHDCSTPSAGDGTRVPAAWLNAIMVLVRQAIRQAGVTEDNTDDLMLWKAIQAGSVVHVGNADTGTVNAMAMTVAPAISAYAAGQIFEIAAGTTTTSTTPTLAVGTLGAKAIVRADGSALVAGELVAGAKTLVAYDATLGKMVLLGVTKAYIDSLLAFVTATTYRNKTAGKILTTDGAWAGMASVTLTDAATIALDLSTGYDFAVTLGGNRTLGAPTNAVGGQKGRILVYQDATGSRTLAWASGYKFAGGVAPTLSTAAGAVDVFYYDVLPSGALFVSFAGRAIA